VLAALGDRTWWLPSWLSFLDRPRASTPGTAEPPPTEARAEDDLRVAR
jgi:hypothetical protein